MRRSVLLAGVLLLLCGLLWTSICSAKMVSVEGTTINMRSGPGEKYTILWKLGKGYPLKVLAAKGDWLRVSDFEDDIGWVHRKLVGRKAHLVVKKQRINLRSGPGTKYKIVGKANHGVVFRTLERRSGWVKVRHENGLTGWVMRSLLWGW